MGEWMDEWTSDWAAGLDPWTLNVHVRTVLDCWEIQIPFSLIPAGNPEHV